MMNAKQKIKDALRRALEALLRVYLSSLPSVDFAPQKIERILVFAYHGLGNFILYTPALKLLRQRYPKARIDLQVGNNTGCEEVLAGADFFDNIYNLPYKSGFFAWLKRIREIRATRYDITINEFHSHSWPLALMVAFSDAPFRVGHVTSPGWSARFSRYSFVFNLPVTMREEEHETQRYLDLVAAIGAGQLEPAAVKPFMHLAEADRAFAQAFIAAHYQMNGKATANQQSASQASNGEWQAANPQAGKRIAKVIGVQPGTSPTMRWKQWPLERYRQLLERLTLEQPEAQIILFGAPNEAAMIEELAAGVRGNLAIAAGKTTIKQVAALIEQCDLLVCNDSGLMHVAVAVDTPVVAIYGPTDLRRTAPLGSQHTVIRHPLPCSPCFKLEGDAQVHLCPHHDCLMTISAEEVLQQVQQAIADGLADRAPGRSLSVTEVRTKFGLQHS
ncbi:MAG: lipopolysaccharide heptosyltransferase II [Acidobacteria bacterium]|nr:lipopolysaccharide heptosyltransferase II [Acidobacteriota bacterium]